MTAVLILVVLVAHGASETGSTAGTVFGGLPAACDGTPRKVAGVVYCDNQFTLWVNGTKVATDPVAFTPHQAVRVEFDWDGKSDITYALLCEDYASPSGYEYVESRRPQLGDGALIARFDDALQTVTSTAWRVHTATFGPSDASIAAGCSATNLAVCTVEDRGIPEGWTAAAFDDSQWPLATSYTAAEAGWGRTPEWGNTEGCCGMTSPVDRSSIGCDAAVTRDQCLDPRSEFSASAAEFIWGTSLERDNRVLFRYTAKCP